MSTSLPEHQPEAESGTTKAFAQKAQILLVLAGLTVYCNSLTKAFVFDDHIWITNNPNIASPRETLSRWIWTRPLLTLSLAFNYAISEKNVASYHALNIAAHLLAGLALYGFVRRTLLLPRWDGRYEQTATHLAFLAALLWLVHPLQTQSVTYIVQRCESMMGMFYLAMMYCFTRGVTSQHPARWYALSLVSFLLSFGFKEVVVTAPLLIVLYDWIFVSARFQELVQKRWGYYLCMSVLWMGMIWLVLGGALGGGESVGVGFTIAQLTPKQYALTQTEVILHYIRLSVLPINQCLDYWGWPTAKSLSEVLGPGIILICLLGLTAYAVWRRSAVGFIAAWFFVILAPTSSFMPIVDVAFEHRMYLSLASLTVLLVISVQKLAERYTHKTRPQGWIVVPLGLYAILLGGMTMLRNETYKRETIIWQDVAEKRPSNLRARFNAITTQSVPPSQKLTQYEQLMQDLQTVGAGGGVRYMLVMNMGALQESEGNLTVAENLFQQTIDHKNRDAAAFRNLGRVKVLSGKTKEAIPLLRRAVEAEPHVADYRFWYGIALLDDGQADAARPELDKADRLDPSIITSCHRQARQWCLDPEARKRADLRRRAELYARAAAAVRGDREPIIWDTLAVALAVNGHFGEAVLAERRAESIAKDQGDGIWQAAARDRLQAYEAGQLWFGNGKDN